MALFQASDFHEVHVKSLPPSLAVDHDYLRLFPGSENTPPVREKHVYLPSSEASLPPGPIRRPECLHMDVATIFAQLLFELYPTLICNHLHFRLPCWHPLLK